mgnify:CR=1 FL=1
MGRGGTDLTAAVLGHALDADEINLYKVEYTTTQKGWLKTWEPGWIGVVHDAEPDQTITTMSYRDAAQLAHFGKKVLHPSTVHPAVEKQIPIFVRNNVDPGHPGTQICLTRGSDDYPVTSVTSVSVAKVRAWWRSAARCDAPHRRRQAREDFSLSLRALSLAAAAAAASISLCFLSLLSQLRPVLGE